MSNLVVKSNKLIEASMHFKVNEYKLILCLLTKLKKNDDSFEKIKLSTKEFREALRIKGESTYDRIKSYCEDLAFKGISITQLDSPRALYITWFSYIKSEAGYIEICFNSKLKEFLLMTSKNFTSYYLKTIISLKSFYSIRIYELLKQYEKIGIREIEVHQLRFMLGLDDKKYKEFSKFRTKILLSSMEEINSKTDIKISFIEIKKGRQVSKIKFFIQRVQNKLENEKLTNLFKRTTGQTIHKDRLEELISLKGFDKVELYINNFYKFMQYKQVRNPSALLYKAVIEEYKIPESFDKDKPIQSSNFDQRVYGDDFFESLYDNLK